MAEELNELDESGDTTGSAAPQQSARPASVEPKNPVLIMLVGAIAALSLIAAGWFWATSEAQEEISDQFLYTSWERATPVQQAAQCAAFGSDPDALYETYVNSFNPEDDPQAGSDDPNAASEDRTDSINLGEEVVPVGEPGPVSLEEFKSYYVDTCMALKANG